MTATGQVQPRAPPHSQSRRYGPKIAGIDKLNGAKSELRFAYDVPFAVHFHLHPRSGARLTLEGGAELILPSGERWRLSASGAALSIEESTHFAEVVGHCKPSKLSCEPCAMAPQRYAGCWNGSTPPQPSMRRTIPCSIWWKSGTRTKLALPHSRAAGDLNRTLFVGHVPC